MVCLTDFILRALSDGHAFILSFLTRSLWRERVGMITSNSRIKSGGEDPIPKAPGDQGHSKIQTWRSKLLPLIDLGKTLWISAVSKPRTEATTGSTQEHQCTPWWLLCWSEWKGAYSRLIYLKIWSPVGRCWEGVKRGDFVGVGVWMGKGFEYQKPRTDAVPLSAYWGTS